MERDRSMVSRWLNDGFDRLWLIVKVEEVTYSIRAFVYSKT